MNSTQTKEMLRSTDGKKLLSILYGEKAVKEQLTRYESVIDGYVKTYGDGDMLLFSSPGRSEITGNHTDHNHGKILGASINLDCVAAAARTESTKVSILSETFNQKFTIDINDLAPSKRKAGTEDLVKGLLMGFKDSGYQIGGFNAYITSDVIASAGVSSSASFETLLAQIINTLFNEDRLDKVTYAHMGKYAENNYWDKGSGLLDQMCCAVGGLITIDFLQPADPVVKKIDFDFSKAGHNLIIVQTGKGHADLTKDYSSIPSEMKKVAEYFHKEVLAEIDEQQLLDHIQDVRKYAGDRSVMRAIHFFEENKRVEASVDALERGDFDAFLSNITASGNSSWKYLQNCYTNSNYQEQGISVALALTELYLADKQCGACRVHGGGFAGVIMAMIPTELVDDYVSYIEKYTEKGAAHIMSIRPLGSICVDEEIQKLA